MCAISTRIVTQITLSIFPCKLPKLFFSILCNNYVQKHITLDPVLFRSEQEIVLQARFRRENATIKLHRIAQATNSRPYKYSGFTFDSDCFLCPVGRLPGTFSFK